jgi:hypothetical protein
MALGGKPRARSHAATWAAEAPEGSAEDACAVGGAIELISDQIIHTLMRSASFL